MQTRYRFPILILTFAVVAVACEKSAPVPAAPVHAHNDHGHADHADHHDHADHADPAGHADHHDHSDHAAHAKPVVDESTDPAGPRLETGTFVLEVASKEPAHQVGKAGVLEIELGGRGQWHINQDYPIRVDLNADPGVSLPKAELVKADAAEFTEDKVKFLAAVEPSEAGDHEVSCKVSFAMCTDDNCVLEKRTVAMQLRVD